MTPEDIAKAREIIADAAPGQEKHPYDDRLLAIQFAAAARTGWPEALDEVERLRKDNLALLQRTPSPLASSGELEKLRAVAEAAEGEIARGFYISTEMASALKAWRGEK